MPLITLEMRRGLSAELKRELLTAVHRALVESFQIPEHDRIQRVIEYAPEDFEIPEGRGDRFTLVTISAFAGRSLEAKRSLYQNIADHFDALGVPRSDVFIVIQEIPVQNWGIRGGQAACDLDLGFRVEV